MFQETGFKFGFPNEDKIAHFSIFFGLSVLFLMTFRRISYLKTFLILIFYGIVIEILQQHMSVNRTGDVVDAIFDGLGILLGILVVHKFTFLKQIRE